MHPSTLRPVRLHAVSPAGTRRRRFRNEAECYRVVPARRSRRRTLTARWLRDAAYASGNARAPGSPPGGRRSERRAYLFRRESASFEEARLTGPFPVVGGRRLAETPGALTGRPLGPERRRPVQGLPGRRGADAASAQLLANAPRAVATTEPRADVLLGEPLLAQKPLRLQCVEHPLDRRGIAASYHELGRKLATCVLAAREQLERPRPKLRFVLAGQAPTASTASSAPPRLGRSLSRSSVSIACAAFPFCLRNSRTLSRPWPMRSPP